MSHADFELGYNSARRPNTADRGRIYTTDARTNTALVVAVSSIAAMFLGIFHSYFAVTITTVSCLLVAGALTALGFRSKTLSMLRVFVLVILLGGSVALLGLTAIHRHSAEAPARAQAIAEAPAKQAAQAALDAAAADAKENFGKIFEFSPVPNPIKMSDTTHGTMDIVVNVRGTYVNETLLIEKQGSTWIAGCQTTRPGTMYPLAADNNHYADILALTGQCPDGIAPPASAPAQS